MRLVLATANSHKLREFKRLLAGVDLMPVPDCVEMPPEDGTTYADNALGKARAAAQATGLPAIADDSGIEAESLGWLPGIRSARFAGEDATDEENLALLESEVKAGGRLVYVCSIALVDPQLGERVFEARCEGRMAEERSGSRGFGYDPVFLPDAAGQGLTMADLSDAEKDRISHRGLAAAQLSAFLAG